MTEPRKGDDVADLAERHRRELLVHCYRMLGSVVDAQDAVQETLLRVWKAADRFDAATQVGKCSTAPTAAGAP